MACLPNLFRWLFQGQEHFCSDIKYNTAPKGKPMLFSMIYIIYLLPITQVTKCTKKSARNMYTVIGVACDKKKVNECYEEI